MKIRLSHICMNIHRIVQYCWILDNYAGPKGQQLYTVYTMRIQYTYNRHSLYIINLHHRIIDDRIEKSIKAKGRRIGHQGRTGPVPPPPPLLTPLLHYLAVVPAQQHRQTTPLCVHLRSAKTFLIAAILLSFLSILSSIILWFAENKMRTLYAPLHNAHAIWPHTLWPTYGTLAHAQCTYVPTQPMLRWTGLSLLYSWSSYCFVATAPEALSCVYVCT